MAGVPSPHYAKLSLLFCCLYAIYFFNSMNYKQQLYLFVFFLFLMCISDKTRAIELEYPGTGTILHT